MKLKCIACEVLARILYYCAARSPHTVDIELLRKGLHDQPANLRQNIQALIDATHPDEYDAVVFGYGLCGKGIDGLEARRLPLVFPKAHDCITLFLGSRDRYTQQFENQPGTYWYALDYIERSSALGPLSSMGFNEADQTPAVYEEYVRKYGQDNADYLMEVMGAWRQHYQRAVLIDTGIGNHSAVEEQAAQDASRRGWRFEKLAGDIRFIDKLLSGNWDGEFLQVPPGSRVVMTFDNEIIGIDEVQHGSDSG